MPQTLDNYIEFAGLFRKLTPFDLDHFADALLCKIEFIGEGAFVSFNKHELNEHDLKTALVEAMRDISIDLQERRLKAAQLELAQMKELMFVCPLKKVA